jgi:putative ABC transport system substrate-binding protein
VFVVGVSATFARPIATNGQAASKLPRIGVLVPAEPASPTEPNVAAFRQALRDLGYIDGQNITVDYRYAHGRFEAFPALADELVRLNVDVLVVASGAAAFAAKKATQTIPVVFIGGSGDPVGAGLVPSLTRPGGNVTGLSMQLGEGFVGKLVALLKEAAPRISRVGHFRTSDPLHFVENLQAATQALGLKADIVDIHDVSELDGLLATMSRERGASFIVVGQALLFPHRSHITDLAAKYRLPAIYSFRLFVDVGGLMSYGPNLPDLWRRAAIYADRILRGTRPGDLPVEQPTKFELVINMKTAKALGLTIPQSLLLRADEVIQ